MSTEHENIDPRESPEGTPTSSEVENAYREGSVGQAAAHLIGVSTKQDEHHGSYLNSDRDKMSDEELVAMGVEPDEGPGRGLILTFIALVAAIIVIGVAVGMLYRGVADMYVAAAATSDDPRLAAVQAEARAVLGAYETVEVEGATLYRVPVNVGMDMLVADPSLLDKHWLGTQSEQPTPAAVPVIRQEAAGTQEGSGAMAPPTPTDPTLAPAEGVPTPINGPDPHAGHDHAAGDHAGHGH